MGGYYLREGGWSATVGIDNIWVTMTLNEVCCPIALVNSVAGDTIILMFLRVPLEGHILQ